VVVEHRNSKVAAPTLNTLTAAGQLGGDVTALVGGKGVQAVAEQAAALLGVNKVCVPVCALPPASKNLHNLKPCHNTKGPTNQTCFSSLPGSLHTPYSNIKPTPTHTGPSGGLPCSGAPTG
jgi:hypothetical protein